MLSHSNMVHYIVYGISHQNQTRLLVDISNTVNGTNQQPNFMNSVFQNRL